MRGRLIKGNIWRAALIINGKPSAEGARKGRTHMIIKKKDLKLEICKKDEGDCFGDFTIHWGVDADNAPPHVKGVGLVTLGPHEPARIHEHHGDAEIYYFISGKGQYTDNGEVTIIEPGDFTITYDGESHGITNIGDEDLVFLAILPYTD